MRFLKFSHRWKAKMKNSNHANSALNSAHSANLSENFAPQTACTAERQKAIKNTIYASLGGILEFYDFILYVFFAVAIFPQIFFPPNSDIWASVGGWVSFGVAYLARANRKKCQRSGYAYTLISRQKR